MGLFWAGGPLFGALNFENTSHIQKRKGCPQGAEKWGPRRGLFKVRSSLFSTPLGAHSLAGGPLFGAVSFENTTYIQEKKGCPQGAENFQ